jgi:uncharacterized membrane protein YdbT with pleckstrin-like domain
VREIDQDFDAALHRRRLIELSCALAAMVIIVVVGLTAGWKYVAVTIVLVFLAAVGISGVEKKGWR